MAGRIAGITIEIGGDTKKLQTALKGVDSSLRNTQNGLKDVDKLLKFNPTNTTLLTQKQELLAKKVTDTKDRLNTLKSSMDQLKNSDGFDENSDEAQRLQREIIATEQELKNAQKEMNNFGSVGAQQLAAVGEKMKEVGGQMTEVGKSMTQKVTAPIVGLGAAAVKVTADFDSSMSQVKAISGATGDEFEQLRSKAREMGETTKFSASESADAMYYMALAGWDTEEMLNGVSGVMALAAAGGSDLATTSDIVTDNLTAFGMAADEASHFADVMTTTMTRSNTTTEMLGESFKYVAPVAGAMGYSVEDVNLALGLMANSGIKASSAGTSLRNIMQRMANPTDDVAFAMEKLGISLDDGQGNMLSFREVMDQMRSGFGDLMISQEEFQSTLAALDSALENGEMSESQYNEQLEALTTSAFGAEGAEKARYASILGGTRAMAGMLAITSASQEDYESLANSINNASQEMALLADGSVVPLSEALASGQEVIETYKGSAEAVAGVMQDNLGGQMTILKSQLQEVAISIGDILMPVIQDIVAKIQEWVDKFNGLDQGQKEMIVKIALIAAAIGPLLVVIGTLISSIGTILTLVPLFAGPIGAIIMLITGLIMIGVSLYKNWDEIKAKASEIWNNIKTTIAGAWDSITSKVSGAVEAVKSKISGGFSAARSTVVSVFNGIKSTVASVWDGIKSKVTSVVNGIKSTVSSVFDSVKSKVTSVWNGIKSAITSPIESAKKTVTDAINKIKSVVNGVKLELPHFKLPHFTISGGKAPWGLGGQGTKPEISVSWYAKAYDNPLLFTSPTILPTADGFKGFGDGNGGELVYGRNNLMRDIRDAVGGTSNVFNITVNGAENPEAFADRLVNQIRLRTRMA